MSGGGGAGGRAREALRHSSEGLRRGSERAGAAISHTLGEPALFAITLSSVVAALFFSLGVVAGDALGLTPLVFLLAGIFFVVTMATYVEGSSLHPERGGASTFARYAFDEFWSFVAGWAILLDYLIVMAIGAVVISDYLAVFWHELGDGRAGDRDRRGRARCTWPCRTSAACPRTGSAACCGSRCSASSCWCVVSLIGFTQYWDPGSIHDSIHLGTAPTVGGPDLRARHRQRGGASASRRRPGWRARSAWGGAGSGAW